MNNKVNWDQALEDIDEHNPLNPYVDNDGYRSTGLTKQEWEDRKADDNEL